MLRAIFVLLLADVAALNVTVLAGNIVVLPPYDLDNPEETTTCRLTYPLFFNEGHIAARTIPYDGTGWNIVSMYVKHQQTGTSKPTHGFLDFVFSPFHVFTETIGVVLYTIKSKS